MWEEAAKFSLFGIDLYAWGTCCALGAFLALDFLWIVGSRRGLKAGTAELAGFLSLVLGILCSRPVFCLLDRGLGQTVPFFAWFRITGGGWSVMGALMGVILASLLTARVTGQKAAPVLDITVLAFLLFLFMERIGENWIPNFDISRQLNDSTMFLSSTFLAVNGEYGDIAFLRTYLLQAAGALILYFVLCVDLRRSAKPGHTFLLFLLLFGAWQTLMESLRYDYHISISFVGLQQIFAMLLVIAAGIVLAVRRWKQQFGLSLATVISLPVASGLVLLLEFGLDRTSISHLLLYALYILVLACPVSLGLLLRKGDQ